MKAVDWTTILLVIVALGTGVSAPQLEAVFPGHGAYIASVISLVALVAGIILRIVTNKTDAPAKAIVADAPVVPPGTAVAPPADEGHPTVLSSTSALLQPKGS